MRVAAIDPGKHRCGVALGVDGIVTVVGWVASSDVPGLVASWAPDVVIMENPKDYVGFAVAHKDLASLRAVLAAVQKKLRGTGAKVQKVTPSEWKGNVPKPIHHARVENVLRDDERFVTVPHGKVGDTVYTAGGHNAWDALALLLYAQGRVGRGGTRR